MAFSSWSDYTLKRIHCRGYTRNDHLDFVHFSLDASPRGTPGKTGGSATPSASATHSRAPSALHGPACKHTATPGASASTSGVHSSMHSRAPSSCIIDTTPTAAASSTPISASAARAPMSTPTIVPSSLPADDYEHEPSSVAVGLAVAPATGEISLLTEHCRQRSTHHESMKVGGVCCSAASESRALLPGKAPVHTPVPVSDFDEDTLVSCSESDTTAAGSVGQQQLQQ